MEAFLTILHYLVSILLIVIVLLQAGKGADIGAAFGGGSSQSLFGPRGAATLLNKVTIVVAGLFLVTSVALSELSKSGRRSSVFERVPPAASPETTPSEAPLTSPESQK